MKRLYAIAVLCVLALIVAGRTQADDYVEDVYYWQDSHQKIAEATVVPTFNKRAREIIFIEDSTSAQHPDTVRAIIR